MGLTPRGFSPFNLILLLYWSVVIFRPLISNYKLNNLEIKMNDILENFYIVISKCLSDFHYILSNQSIEINTIII